jgi:site-specific DNA-adenine methylase
MKHKVYIGDNAKVMGSDDFSQYEGKVSVIYIDPPYNTKTKKSYNDKQAGEEWLSFMSTRLLYASLFISTKRQSAQWMRTVKLTGEDAFCLGE